MPVTRGREEVYERVDEDDIMTNPLQVPLSLPLVVCSVTAPETATSYTKYLVAISHYSGKAPGRCSVDHCLTAHSFNDRRTGGQELDCVRALLKLYPNGDGIGFTVMACV